MNRVRKEHVNIICDPGLSYFGNVTPSRASRKAISNEIFVCLIARSAVLDSVVVVRCDEPVVIAKQNGRVINSAA